MCSGKMAFKWAGTTPKLNIWDLDMMREILQNKSGEILKPRVNPLIRLLVMGVASLEGEVWAHRRKLINPAFHMEKLKVPLHVLAEFHDSFMLNANANILFGLNSNLKV